MPKESGLPNDVVGFLVKCAYRTRDAGAIWEETFAGALMAMGFVRGAASACCFYHPTRDIAIVVHGDDFTAIGEDEDLDWYEASLGKYFELKLRGRLGAGDKDVKEMRILNRILRIDSQGLKYEADPRHAEILIQSLGISNAKSVISPGVKEAYNEDDQSHEDLTDLVAAVHSKKKHNADARMVTFSPKIESHDVTPYSESYSAHPKQLVFNRHGLKMLKSNEADRFTGKSPRIMIRRAEENLAARETGGIRRGEILKRVLEQGAAWEVQTEVRLALIAAMKSPKKRKVVTRAGAKKVKQFEQLVSPREELSPAEATSFRALAARANYLAQDRPDIAFAAKELCREFAKPSKSSYLKLKRLARYLLGKPRLIWKYDYQDSTTQLRVFVDTDFAGCHKTRRSTSGGCGLIGSHLIKAWSTTQTTIALSSGEAELTGIVKGAAQAMGLRSVAQDLGMQWEIDIQTVQLLQSGFVAGED